MQHLWSPVDLWAHLNVSVSVLASSLIMRQCRCLTDLRPCSVSVVSVGFSHHYCWTSPSNGLEVFSSEPARCLQLDATFLPWGCCFCYQGVVTHNPQETAFGKWELGRSDTFPQNCWLLGSSLRNGKQGWTSTLWMFFFFMSIFAPFSCRKKDIGVLLNKVKLIFSNSVRFMKSDNWGKM